MLRSLVGSEMCIRDSLCAVRIRFLDIPEENTLHYLSGKVIKLKDPQIVKQFDALDKNKEGVTS